MSLPPVIAETTVKTFDEEGEGKVTFEMKEKPQKSRTKLKKITVTGRLKPILLTEDLNMPEIQKLIEKKRSLENIKLHYKEDVIKSLDATIEKPGKNLHSIRFKKTALTSHHTQSVDGIVKKLDKLPKTKTMQQHLSSQYLDKRPTIPDDRN